VWTPNSHGETLRPIRNTPWGSLTVGIARALIDEAPGQLPSNSVLSADHLRASVQRVMRDGDVGADPQPAE